MSFAREHFADLTLALWNGSACRRVAPPHILFIAMTGHITTGPHEQRPEAALVYRDHSRDECWLVGVPSAAGEPHAFTGPNARQAALEFAHRTYGSARSFAN